MSLRNPHVVEQLETCSACPVQYEGRLDDGRHFYFRYRSGRAGLGAGPTQEAARAEQFTGGGAYLNHGDSLQGVFESDDDLNQVFDHLLTARRGREERAGECLGCGSLIIRPVGEELWCSWCRAGG